MVLSSTSPAKFIASLLGKKMDHVYLLPKHDWVFFLNGKPAHALIICLDNLQPRMQVQSLEINHSLLKDLTPHSLDQHLRDLIITEVTVDPLFCLVFHLNHQTKDRQKEPYQLKLQLSPYAPRFTLFKQDIPMFDSILGWQPKTEIKVKQSRLLIDPTLNVENLHLTYLTKQYHLLINQHYQKKVKRQQALEKDFLFHQNQLGYQQLAEAILTEPNLAWKDYVNPGKLPPPKESFQCDVAGANMLFHLYKKAKHGVDEVANQLDKNKEAINSFLKYLQLLDAPNSTNLEAIQSFLVKEHLISGAKPKPVQVSHQSPYFIVDENIKFSFGKNAKQNDHLTFSLAKKSEIFMHIHGQPGSHVIVHQSNFNHESIVKGAQLVLALANKISGEITYAKVGSLKRTTQLGQVLVKDAKKIKVQANPNWADEVLRLVKRY
jgi:hypothetical protein